MPISLIRGGQENGRAAVLRSLAPTDAPAAGETRIERGGPETVRSHHVTALSVFSPAKLNLMLAITGRRADGFHELVSVVAPVAWGDTLIATPEDPAESTDAGAFSLTCDDAAVPVGDANLIIKAAQAFRSATGWRGGVRFGLEKRIPMGAGLGGGSSNAVAALRALNRLAGGPLSPDALAALAVSLGSDCALFLHEGPVVMRGRGDVVEPLPVEAARRLRGRSVLIFKPAFGIATAWAYARLAATAPASYVSAAEAEARMQRWMKAEGKPTGDSARGASALENLLFNNMEPPAFLKFPALPALLEQLAVKFTLTPHLSGSGSACFALLPEPAAVPAITAAIHAAWGGSATVVHTRLA